MPTLNDGTEIEWGYGESFAFRCPSCGQITLAEVGDPYVGVNMSCHDCGEKMDAIVYNGEDRTETA